MSLNPLLKIMVFNGARYDQAVNLPKLPLVFDRYRRGITRHVSPSSYSKSQHRTGYRHSNLFNALSMPYCNPVLATHSSQSNQESSRQLTLLGHFPSQAPVHSNPSVPSTASHKYSLLGSPLSNAVSELLKILIPVHGAAAEHCSAATRFPFRVPWVLPQWRSEI